MTILDCADRSSHTIFAEKGFTIIHFAGLIYTVLEQFMHLAILAPQYSCGSANTLHAVGQYNPHGMQTADIWANL